MKDFTWQKRKFVLYCMVYNYIYNFHLFWKDHSLCQLQTFWKETPRYILTTQPSWR